MTLLSRAVGLLPLSWIKSVARLQWRHPLLKRGFDLVSATMRRGDQVIQGGVGKGLKFRAGNANAGYLLGSSEPFLQAALQLVLRPSMTVFDLGASVGYQSMLSACLVGSSGRVISFEPVAENVELIRHNARLNSFNHVTAEQVAIGDHDGEVSFQLSTLPNWGRIEGLGTPKHYAGSRTVPLRTLDSIIHERHYPTPSVIKCDVEGAEAQVLAGAERVLSQGRPLWFIDLHGTNKAVAVILARHRYALHALGRGGQSVPDGPWDLQIVAIPEERADLLALVPKLIDPELGPAD